MSLAAIPRKRDNHADPTVKDSDRLTVARKPH